MSDISNLKIGNNIFSIKDPTARTTATNADTKADQAIIDSSTALNKANEANQNATNANTKINNAKIIGNYTENTETIEILLKFNQN